MNVAHFQKYSFHHEISCHLSSYTKLKYLALLNQDFCFLPKFRKTTTGAENLRRSFKCATCRTKKKDLKRCFIIPKEFKHLLCFLSFLPFFLSFSFLSSFLPSFLPTYLPSYLPSFLSSFHLSFYPSFCLHLFFLSSFPRLSFFFFPFLSYPPFLGSGSEGDEVL